MFDFGFIGTGAMGGALALAVSKNEYGYNALLSDKDSKKAEELASKIGAESGEIKRVCEECKFIFLGVKPQMRKGLFDEIGEFLRARKDRFVRISMVAGTSISRIEELAGMKCPVIRIMPSLPCSIGEGITMASRNDEVSEDEFATFMKAMEFSGFVDEVAESLIDVGASVSGSGPAFAFMMIEALADGAVDCGFPRDKAYKYAANMLIGSSKLFLSSGKSPSELKDSVCSPNGTTIEGVRALEKGAFRSSVFEAVRATYEKTLKLSEKKKPKRENHYDPL